MRPLGRRPGIHNPQSWLWIPGSLAQRKIDFVNLSLSKRPGMTVLEWMRGVKLRMTP
jgi:hypothetical protein